MDILKLKNLIKQSGEKIIFMENGEPELVMMSFAEYEKIAQRDLLLPKQGNLLQETRLNDKQFFDRDINALHETEFVTPAGVESNRMGTDGIDVPVRTHHVSSQRPEAIRLEDLPI